MNKTIRKKALKHTAYDAVVKEAAKVPKSKIETLCKIVCFDNGIVGEAVECRAVLFSHTLYLYRIEEITTLPDRRDLVRKEVLLGKINSNCVVTTGRKLSKYHRHTNSHLRYAPIKGKCTILTAKEGNPLFVPFLDKLLDLHHKEVSEGSRHHHHHHHQGGHPLDMGKNSSLSPGMQPAMSTFSGTESTVNCSRMAGNGASNLFLPESVHPNGFRNYLQTLGAEERTLEVSHFSGSYQSGGTFGSNRSRPRNTDKKNPSVADVSTWRCIAIKFPTRRENERWLNLLQSNERTNQWNSYLTHMPCNDVFNLLVARLFFENTTSNKLHDLLFEKIQDKFSSLAKNLGHNVKGNIYLDKLTIGGEVPLISNVSEAQVSSCGDLEFAFDLLYRGGLVLAPRFSITYRDIKVPDIRFTIKILELAGRVRLNVGPPHTKKFWLSFPQLPELRLDLSQDVISSEGFLGTALSLLPDLSSIISNVLKEKIFEDMILPQYDFFPWVYFDDHFKDENDDESAADEKKSGSNGSTQEASASREPPPKTKKEKKEEENELKKERKEEKKKAKLEKKRRKHDKSSNAGESSDQPTNTSMGWSESSAQLSPASKNEGATESKMGDNASGRIYSLRSSMLLGNSNPNPNAHHDTRNSSLSREHPESVSDNEAQDAETRRKEEKRIAEQIPCPIYFTTEDAEEIRATLPESEDVVFMSCTAVNVPRQSHVARSSAGTNKDTSHSAEHDSRSSSNVAGGDGLSRVSASAQSRVTSVRRNSLTDPLQLEFTSYGAQSIARRPKTIVAPIAKGKKAPAGGK